MKRKGLLVVLLLSLLLAACGGAPTGAKGIWDNSKWDEAQWQ
ncbi:hypothetical protein [Calidithermus timidus]|jgi:major membrane immunogen (membrane-anchored lipoprotein)|nr:hypothetical protein [Calidithermus timidus]